MTNFFERVVTLADCARCPLVSMCDAHITDGEWKHCAGVNPCVIVTRDDAAARLNGLE
jgi:hypothetical protein